MKFTVCMKTPDALSYAIESAADEQDCEDFNIDQEEVEKLCRKWFKDGETVWLEIDTNAMTCEVVAL